MIRYWKLAAGMLSLSLIAGLAWGQTEAPVVVSNDDYQFEFKVEAGSVVTYRQGGTGFTCIHNKSGGVAGSKPDYGLVVFATETYTLSDQAAKAAGLGEEQLALTLADVVTQTRLDEIVSAQMSVHDRELAGQARVTRSGSSETVEVPYFKWIANVGLQTRHALMYVVRHDTGFVVVQVESPSPLGPAVQDWLTSNLTLVQQEAAAAPTG